jgi:hypothetical protein
MTSVKNERLERSAEKWQSYDAETSVKYKEIPAEDGKVTIAVDHIDHGASAKANWKEAGKDLLNMVDFTNHFRETWTDAYKKNTIWSKLWAVLMVPVNTVQEVWDVALGPWYCIKDVSDAVAHASLSGVNKIRSQE